MNHILEADFWKFCARLPLNIQRRVPQKFQLLRQNPRHPSLRQLLSELQESVVVGVY